MADHALFFLNGNPPLDLYIYISFHTKGGGPMPKFFMMLSDKWYSNWAVWHGSASFSSQTHRFRDMTVLSCVMYCQWDFCDL